MKNKKDSNFYLQHKLPWESDWEYVESGKSEGCEEFIKILINEPPHLVETEYRIVKNVTTELRNKNKSVTYPVCIISGTEMSKKLKELKQRN